MAQSTIKIDSAKETAAAELGKLSRILRQYADTFENYASEITNQPAIYEGSLRTTAADRMGWAINDVGNVLMNLNLSRLSAAQAKLAVAIAEIK